MAERGQGCHHGNERYAVHADVGGLVNFLKDWMSLHVQQASASPEPVFARHHVYPVSLL